MSALRIAATSVFLCTAAGAIYAAEHVVLRSGFRISADKVELVDGQYILHTPTGVTQFQEAQVERVERDDYVAPPAPAAPLVNAQAAVPKPRPTIQELVTKAALANGLPPEIVHSVARAESAYQTKAVSSKGAIGVMQLMPATAASLQADPNDPEQNIEAGTRYLRDLLVKYDGDSVKALAAYNAGPGAVDKYNGVPPYRETISYVDRVLKNYTKLVEKNKAQP